MLEPDLDPLACSECGAVYPRVEGVPVLVAGLTAQHEHQRAYFDREFSRLGQYRVDAWRRSFNDRIFEALRIGNCAESYLDVGAGGVAATVIEAARLGVRSVGCDLSIPGVVTAARFAAAEGVGDRSAFVVCSADDLPFSDASFGAASAVAVLEHLDDDAAAARELARVVEPGGRVWVTVPHAYVQMFPPVWPVYWIHDRRIGHHRHYGAERLRKLFAGVGFRLVERQFTGHPVKLVQFAAATAAGRAGRDGSGLWWRLERADLRARSRALWAMQLSSVFERA
jgi:ubiquinone/menaquinone biosynthesis C-methylase UbiE